MEKNKDSQVKVYQAYGSQAANDINAFLKKNKICREQIIDLNVWHEYLNHEQGPGSVLTLLYWIHSEER